MALLRERKRDRGRLTPSHARAKVQERTLASRVGGAVVKGSGCGFEKGDVRLKGVVRLEAKCTKNASFSVTRAMIEKLEQAALGAGEMPALVVEFLDDAGNPLHELAVVPTYVLDMMAKGVE